ncbi:hypothetical protein NADE_000337 [Nannochloris sp. 'desiccata']|nr:hypothetical protein NADE_000337 [Chlorella desiccata (nom. nud.)]
MGSYSPLGSRPGTPRTPITPRTKHARWAYFLALASFSLSTFAILSVSVLPFGRSNSLQPSHRVVLKSFLLSPNDKLLYQNKPLLVPEEDLSITELALLRMDQNDREVDALQGMSERAKQRAAIVQQLVAEFDGDTLSDEVLQKIQRRWSRFSITEEDEVNDIQASESSTNHHGGFIDDGGYPDEEEEHLAATMALESKLDEYQEEDDYDDQVLDLSQDIGSALGEDINADSTKGEVELLKPIEEEDEDAYPDELDAILHGTTNGVDPDFSFRDLLSACLTISCLKEAHIRHKEPTQFNFPHAILMGWQDSAVGRLAEHLSSHPQVINSDERASEFFTTKCHDSPSTGCSRADEAHYIQRTLQRNAVAAAEGRIMSFESSIQYAAAGDLLASQLSETLPWLKIVTTFREPISRAFSFLAHRAYRENTGCLAMKTVDVYPCLIHELLESTEGGSYSQSMAHWMRAFPKEQLYVVQYEGLSGVDGQAGLQGVKAFLGVDPALPFENLPVDTINTDGWPIRKEQYQDLVATVRADAESLAQLIESNGLGSSKEWMARWEATWQNTLDSCDADGQCNIQL